MADLGGGDHVGSAYPTRYFSTMSLMNTNFHNFEPFRIKIILTPSKHKSKCVNKTHHCIIFGKGLKIKDKNFPYKFYKKH